ncbi:chitinase 2-like [Salvia miltiorrhiza]|uniref:chitinase 2-like n=1 Tax=Salvia miltiorrhiza TaxID=226208 RepID=UPI0025AD44F2|nr:chitinase 2-like [Salvia miltiorrhiza]
MGPSPRHPLALLVFQALIIASCAKSGPANSNLFREYLGAEFKNVKFSDVPVNSGVEFHYILSFAIDYTTDPSSPSPTDGEFNVFWDTGNLSPGAVAAIKSRHPNVRVALSLGGDSVGDGESAFFAPSSPDTWVANAVSSLTRIIREYDLDGIDIDYEHFKADPATFARCVGRLITTLKANGVVSFASIAPFDDDEVQSHYMALWKDYGHVIDYVNFQFYAYDAGTTVEQFLRYFEEQSGNYGGGKVLPSFISDGSGGLAPDGGFFTACSRLKSEGKLYGIFVWCADDSKGLGFKYEKQSQSLIAISH